MLSKGKDQLFHNDLQDTLLFHSLYLHALWPNTQRLVLPLYLW